MMHHDVYDSSPVLSDNVLWQLHNLPFPQEIEPNNNMHYQIQDQIQWLYLDG